VDKCILKKSPNQKQYDPNNIQRIDSVVRTGLELIAGREVQIRNFCEKMINKDLGTGVLTTLIMN